MRKALVWMMVSLDGYMEGPNQDLSWHRVDEELHQYFNDELASMGGFLEGRVSHEMMAAFWPTADADPAASQAVRDFAKIWREMPKILYSRTVTHAEWNTTVVREVVPDEVLALKAADGGDLVVGGADLAASFMRLGLIDELWIHVNPVVVGAGTPLFPPGLRLDLTLIDSREFDNGVVRLRYAVKSPS